MDCLELNMNKEIGDGASAGGGGGVGGSVGKNANNDTKSSEEVLTLLLKCSYQGITVILLFVIFNSTFSFSFRISFGALFRAVIVGHLVDLKCLTFAIACCMLKFSISSRRSGLRGCGDKICWKFRACSSSILCTAQV